MAVQGESEPGAGPDLAALDPAEVARLVRDASDEDLASGFATNRRQILDAVFARMGERLRPGAAESLDAIVEWRIRGDDEEEGDRYQLHIADGRCRLLERLADDPRVRFTLGPVDFLRLVTGNANGPRLFLFGRLKVEGDMMLAARIPALFAIPRAQPPDAPR